MGSSLLVSAAASLDVEQVKEVIGLAKECMSLFSVYPLNILLIAGLAGAGFAIFKKARGATGAPA